MNIMNKKIVIATHASLADGFKEALGFFTGSLENVYTICAFTRDKNPQSEIEALLKSFASDDLVIVFSDLAGGSVNKMLVKMLKDRKFYLITGINLGMLLELALCDVNEINENKIREVVANANEQTYYVNDRIKELEEKNDDEQNFFDN